MNTQPRIFYVDNHTMHPRIEKAAHRRGEYIGFCNGAQRIRRSGSMWQTYQLGSTEGRFIAVSAPTLVQLGDKLDKIAKATNPQA
jgi:hypothetical protein